NNREFPPPLSHSSSRNLPNFSIRLAFRLYISEGKRILATGTGKFVKNPRRPEGRGPAHKVCLVRWVCRSAGAHPPMRARGDGRCRKKPNNIDQKAYRTLSGAIGYCRELRLQHQLISPAAMN